MLEQDLFYNLVDEYSYYIKFSHVTMTCHQLIVLVLHKIHRFKKNINYSDGAIISKVGQQSPRPMERRICGGWKWYRRCVYFCGGLCEALCQITQPSSDDMCRDNSTRSICKSALETPLHALAECPHACMFWPETREILNVKLPRLHPDTWAADILCESWWI
jgi:hypothetical protein